VAQGEDSEYKPQYCKKKKILLRNPLLGQGTGDVEPGKREAVPCQQRQHWA
jgi:hypothetical protein